MFGRKKKEESEADLFIKCMDGMCVNETERMRGKPEPRRKSWDWRDELKRER